jgi:hypothetical protein
VTSRRDGPGAMNDEDERRFYQERFTATLAGLAVALLLGLVALYLLDELTRISKQEDCVMQGRRNCAPVQLHR